jgi:hypothetical protein
MNETDNQIDNTSKPWLWKKGQSGNLKGRPKGKTLKEWTREYLQCMSDEERENFMDGLPKELIWKMGEGNPSTNTDITVKDATVSSELKEKIDQVVSTYINGDSKDSR